MDDSGRQAEALQEVDLKIIGPETCHKTENSGFLVDEAMFCAGYIEGGKDGCQGDSGGPLICAEGGQPVLRGITSKVSKVPLFVTLVKAIDIQKQLGLWLW